MLSHNSVGLQVPMKMLVSHIGDGFFLSVPDVWTMQCTDDRGGMLSRNLREVSSPNLRCKLFIWRRVDPECARCVNKVMYRCELLRGFQVPHNLLQAPGTKV